IVLLENGDIVQRDGVAPVRMEFKDGRFEPKMKAPVAAAALRGPEVKVDVDLFQPLPSQVLGGEVIEEIKKEIVRDPNLNRGGQVRPEDIHEITCDQADLNKRMDEVVAQMIETKAVTPPKDLYFITNEGRKNGVQVIGMYPYEIDEAGEGKIY